MIRWSDEKFINDRPPYEHVIAIRIVNGEFYFIAWMEKAEEYVIVASPDPNNDKYKMFKDTLMTGDIYQAVTEMDGYNSMNLYTMFDRDEYEAFLELCKPYTLDGKSDGDHDIMYVSYYEFIALIDAFRDGDYVFIMTYPIMAAYVEGK